MVLEWRNLLGLVSLQQIGQTLSLAPWPGRFHGRDRLGRAGLLRFRFRFRLLLFRLGLFFVRFGSGSSVFRRGATADCFWRRCRPYGAIKLRRGLAECGERFALLLGG